MHVKYKVSSLIVLMGIGALNACGGGSNDPTAPGGPSPLPNAGGKLPMPPTHIRYETRASEEAVLPNTRAYYNEQISDCEKDKAREIEGRAKGEWTPLPNWDLEIVKLSPGDEGKLNKYSAEEYYDGVKYKAVMTIPMVDQDGIISGRGSGAGHYCHFEITDVTRTAIYDGEYIYLDGVATANIDSLDILYREPFVSGGDHSALRVLLEKIEREGKEKLDRGDINGVGETDRRYPIALLMSIVTRSLTKEQLDMLQARQSGKCAVAGQDGDAYVYGGAELCRWKGNDLYSLPWDIALRTVVVNSADGSSLSQTVTLFDMSASIPAGTFAPAGATVKVWDPSLAPAPIPVVP